jgi:hypothetical protein
MDVTKTTAAYEAGIRQGADEGERIAQLWNG